MYPAMGSGKTFHHREKLANERKRQTIFSSIYCRSRFQGCPGGIYLIPQTRENILDVLNGPRIGGIQVSPSGKYLIMTEGEIIKGKSSSMTNVYRIADKEIVYTFYGNNVSNLTWIPGEDKLSYLIKEGTGNSLYTYDIEQQKLERLFRDDQTISSFSVVTGPELSYLLQK